MADATTSVIGRQGQGMYDKLTPSDVKKIEEEIEYRKLVVRKGGH